MVKASDLEEFGSRRWQILAAYDEAYRNSFYTE